MSKKSDYHVVPSASGGWSVRREGKDRPIGVFDKKSDAMERGRYLARTSKSELIEHGKNGRIRGSAHYGSDPFPPKSPKGFGSLGEKLLLRHDIDITKPIYGQATQKAKKGSQGSRKR
jgi:hypothetical protein